MTEPTVFIDQEQAENFLVAHHAIPVEHELDSLCTIFEIEGAEWLQVIGEQGEYRLEKMPVNNPL